MINLIIAILLIALTPAVGGLIAGADRRITARLQSRFGPPIMQPFYDVLKLIGKAPMVVNSWQVLCAYIYLVSSVLACFLFFLQGDLLLLFFVMTIGAVFQVVGAMSMQSPYSQVGAQRELLQMLAYEPLIILVFVGISMSAGSFVISDVYALETPMLIDMPFLYLALGYALTIKLRKSPFDLAGSHHGHQELVKGVQTEYSGPHLALLEIGHWFDVVLLLGLCSLFWHTSIIGMAVLLVVTYLVEIIIDNTCARMTWPWMLRNVFSVGIGMSVLNILWLYVC